MKKLNKALKLAKFIADKGSDIEIFGMFGPGNLGDEAMLVAAFENLPRGRVIPWPSYAIGRALDRFIELRRRPHLLVGGGTLIHGGNTGWLDYLEMRSMQGVQVSFFGTGISFTPEEMSSRTEPYRRWCSILNQSTNVHLRGPKSVAIAREMGSEADVFGDFAFMLYDSKIPITDHSKRENSIGLNFGYCLADQNDFENKSVELVKSLSGIAKLVFYTVVDTDQPVTQRIIERSGLRNSQYTVENHFYDPHAFMASARLHKGFIGLKLHAAGLAMVAGVPTVMIAYKDKSFDFMAPIKANYLGLVTLPINANQLSRKIDDLLTSPQKYVVSDAIAELTVHQRNLLREIYRQESN